MITLTTGRPGAGPMLDAATLAKAHLRCTVNEALEQASRALLESDQAHVPAHVTDNLFIAVVRLTNAIQAL